MEHGIHLKKSRDGQFYWVAIAKNGKQVCKSSETYKTKNGAKKSVRSSKLLIWMSDIIDNTKKKK